MNKPCSGLLAATVAAFGLFALPAIGSPDADAPTTQPVAAAPATQPVADVPTTEPVAETPATMPAADGAAPATQPVAGTPTTEPAAETPTTMPAAEAAADNPAPAVAGANASDSGSSLAPGTGTIAAYTAPSDSRKLAFGVSDLSTALVMSVNVKEGDQIKKGQLLEEMDDRIEQAAVKTAQIKAASTAELDAEKADLKVKQSVLKRKTDTFNQNGYNTSEIEEAGLDVTTDEKRVQLAQEEQAEAALMAQSEQAKIDTMRIVAPFDGTVLKIISHAGETSDPHSPDGAIQVVKNDPLYVEVGELTTKQAAVLKIGQTLRVRYPDETTAHEATVIYRAPQADARSDTQAVRLSMPNPENRDSGMHVIVELPPDVAGAAVPAAPIAGNTGP